MVPALFYLLDRGSDAGAPTIETGYWRAAGVSSQRMKVDAVRLIPYHEARAAELARQLAALEARVENRGEGSA
jgi:hypothetical protein